MTCGPGPGMLNVIGFGVPLALVPELRNAWRNDPGPLSLVLTTVKVTGGSVLVATTASENSDVLRSGSVAVAVIWRPNITSDTFAVNEPLPDPSVVTLADPRYFWPSPRLTVSRTIL